MRDVVLAVLIFAICMAALVRPWVGVMGWTWLSLMNPHALTWKLNTMPVAAAIALCTLIGLLFTKERRDFSLPAPSIILILFMLWMCITLPFSFNVEGSIDMWKRVMKIDFMILVTLVILHTKRHLTIFTWTVVGSIGYYGIKGGAFTLLTGGNSRVWGPTGTFIEGNNEIALALVIVIPLLRFLQLQIASKWLRIVIAIVMLLCAVAAMGTHSRGALLAIGAMGMALWWHGGRNIGLLMGILLASAIAFLFLPEQWFYRMNTISDYQNDSSAMGRINAWWMAWNLAKDRFFGGGFDIYNIAQFAIYAPIPDDIHAAHSIYFQVLGEHGFVGLFLFILLWWVVWWQASHLARDGKRLAETLWISQLGAMCQVSLIGYAVGGAFLSLAYFDLPYNILIMVVIARRWLNRQAWLEETEPSIDKPETTKNGTAIQ